MFVGRVKKKLQQKQTKMLAHRKNDWNKTNTVMAK